MSSTQPKIASLRGLVPLMRRADGFADVIEALSRGDSAAIDGAWGSSCALAAAALVARDDQPHRRQAKPRAGNVVAPEFASRPVLVIVLPRISQVDDFAVDLAGFLDADLSIFPAWETLPREHTATDPVFTGRMRVLRELLEGADQTPSPAQQGKSVGGPIPARVIVTSFPALLQPVPGRDELRSSTRTLRVGESIDPEQLLRWLVEQGFERATAIELPGEFSMHGGILDVFPHADAEPIRVEFFGDEIESIRRFDATTQRKIADLTSVGLTVVRATGTVPLPDETSGDVPRRATPPGPLPSQGEDAQSVHFVDWLPAGSWIGLVELAEMLDEGRHYLGRLDNPRGFFGVDATLKRCVERPTVTIAALAGDGFETSCHLRVQSVERFDVPAGEVIGELAKVVGRDERVLIACHNPGEEERLAELLAATDLPATGRVELCQGYLLRGFRLADERLIVLSDHELFGRRDIRRTTVKSKTAKLESRAIDSFLELSEGDLVVHLTKGIARYRGMQMLTEGEQQEENLTLEFRDSVRMFVPVSLIHLVQKYVGGSKTAPTLSKIGSGSWERKKNSVAEAVADMAGDMIMLQAARDAKTGLVFPPDSHWQQEFEAAFAYIETIDQVSSIAALKQDMQQPRPMDRLICGDVGYGKTEVAMRGAFKAIDAGRQVAVLVPTTVLAEQHYRTFCERMAEFPFKIEVLSRFRTKAEQRQVLAGLHEGTVDLVIGTHRLIQPDVRFHDLGLLVIDEEQRFGVEAKEMLKNLRLEVDVLTLSATPIPRTLHLSLLGIRDISNLQTPPHDRLSIETRICRFDAELIRQAIVRELNRGGQVYFVHNRVYDIETIADRLQSIVPEARIGIVHGQMGEHELEDTMVAFVNGALDVLVATTIIESGLDIPNANTILIHQADKYGLADLHQLRGRVGRYKHRAYCYLLLEEGQSLSSTAARRLKAIEEFSELGAGFKIAMRDLEIRGAGNILGTEQSGHIASVGYELYCQLLENAVRRLKNQPIRASRHVAIDLPLPAFLPGSYVPPGRPKIEVYRKFSRVETLPQLDELDAELRDRFGPPPDAVLNLIELKRLQLLAQAWQIDDIHLEDTFAVFGYRNPQRIGELVDQCQAQSQNRLRVVDGRSAYLVLPSGETAGNDLLTTLKAVLQQSAVPV
ncbi:MAG: transcription-repair coupling factor [Planctomycetaceae bacterium]|nr:transcription-repair coupling factor [Planctomycetaceae bacterium]